MIGNQIDNGTSTATIIGVVGDARQDSLTKPPVPEIYYPVGQSQDAMDLERMMSMDDAGNTDRRGTCPSGGIFAQGDFRYRSRVAALYGQTLVAAIADSIGDRRLNVWLVGSFAVVAFVARWPRTIGNRFLRRNSKIS